MNDLQTFNFEQLPVRTLEVDGEPLFIGSDVAEILGYSNTRDALSRHVDEEDKKILTSRNTTLENLPNRGITAINESGLYALIFSSKLESAKRFKRWVTSEVLPTLRKSGTFQTKPLSTNEQIKLIALGTHELDERVTAIETSIPLFPGESAILKKCIDRKAMEIMKNQFNGIERKRISRKIYSSIYNSLFKAFNVSSYKMVPRGKFKDVIRFVETWHLPSETVYQIEFDLKEGLA